MRERGIILNCLYRPYEKVNSTVHLDKGQTEWSYTEDKAGCVEKVYLVPHLQHLFGVGVHGDELIGYCRLANPLLLCPLQPRQQS